MKMVLSNSCKCLATYCKTLAFPNSLKHNFFDVLYFVGSTADTLVACQNGGNLSSHLDFAKLSKATQTSIADDLKKSKTFNAIVVDTVTERDIMHIKDDGADAATVVWYNEDYFEATPPLTYPKEMQVALICGAFLYQMTKFDGVPTALKLMEISCNMAKPDKTKGQYITRNGVDALIALSGLSNTAPEITFDVGYEYERIVRPLVSAIPSYDTVQVADLREAASVIIPPTKPSVPKDILLSDLKGKACYQWVTGTVKVPDTYTWVKDARIVYCSEVHKKELDIYFAGIEASSEAISAFIKDNGLNPADVIFIKI